MCCRLWIARVTVAWCDFAYCVSVAMECRIVVTGARVYISLSSAKKTHVVTKKNIPKENFHRKIQKLDGAITPLNYIFRFRLEISACIISIKWLLNKCFTLMFVLEISHENTHTLSLRSKKKKKMVFKTRKIIDIQIQLLPSDVDTRIGGII